MGKLLLSIKFGEKRDRAEVKKTSKFGMEMDIDFLKSKLFNIGLDSQFLYISNELPDGFS